MRRRGGFSKTAKQREHVVVVEALAENGYDYVTLEGHGSQLSGAVREEDVKKFFTSFEVDKVRLAAYIRRSRTNTFRFRSSKTTLAGMSRSRQLTPPAEQRCFSTPVLVH